MNDDTKLALSLSARTVGIAMHALQSHPGLPWLQTNPAIIELNQQAMKAQQEEKARAEQPAPQEE